MPADSGADATPPPSQSLVPASGASPSNLLNLIARGANINDPVEVVQQVKAESNAAAKGNPKAKAKSKPAAKADPKKVTTRKSASASNSSASASSGPFRKPAAAKTKVHQHFRKPKGKKHVIHEVQSLSAKAFKPNKLSGFDKMVDICKPVVRKRAHEETDDEAQVDWYEEEGEEEEGLNDDGVVNPNTFAPDSKKLDRSKKKKFDQLLESGLLPANAIAMYSAARTLKTGKTKGSGTLSTVPSIASWMANWP